MESFLDQKFTVRYKLDEREVPARQVFHKCSYILHDRRMPEKRSLYEKLKDAIILDDSLFSTPDLLPELNGSSDEAAQREERYGYYFFFAWHQPQRECVEEYLHLEEREMRKRWMEKEEKWCDELEGVLHRCRMREEGDAAWAEK